jgi:hypothetical protein
VHHHLLHCKASGHVLVDTGTAHDDGGLGRVIGLCEIEAFVITRDLLIALLQFGLYCPDEQIESIGTGKPSSVIDKERLLCVEGSFLERSALYGSSGCSGGHRKEHGGNEDLVQLVSLVLCC